MPNPETASFVDLRPRLREFDAIIDVRSPAEYADDHLPGAINHPVLDDAQRALVGTLYKQQSAFEARKVGAALVAANIAATVSGPLAGLPQHWKPLVYCWRGGQRSASLAHVLARIGWQVSLLEGGYKTFRRAVIDELETLPTRFRFRVIAGPTGSGKSRLLRALSAQGAQVLDLEQLAQHRGSVLGDLPGQEQPSQRGFEAAIWKALGDLSGEREVYVEAESKRIGKLRVPEKLMAVMRASPCVNLELPAEQRVRLLAEEYRHLVEAPQALISLLQSLTELHGRTVIDAWCDAARQGLWEHLVSDLLARHYDPSYARSTHRNYVRLREAERLDVTRADDTAFEDAARRLVAGAPRPCPDRIFSPSSSALP